MASPKIYPIYLNQYQIQLIQDALMEYSTNPDLIDNVLNAINISVEREDKKNTPAPKRVIG
jgi:hypothetical protein